MPSVSVSNLELYRMWRKSEDLELAWLLRRLRGEEPPTEAMLAGTALHKALENITEGEAMNLSADGFKFNFLCDTEVEILPAKELSIEKQYGELTVRGRVDGMLGRTVTDYKSTQSFDADRLLEGFQWRYYLDMADCDSFIWKVFVLSERFYREYDVIQTHELRQHRYERMGRECEALARDFLAFVTQLEASGVSWTKGQSAEPGPPKAEMPATL